MSVEIAVKKDTIVSQVLKPNEIGGPTLYRAGQTYEMDDEVGQRFVQEGRGEFLMDVSPENWLQSLSHDRFTLTDAPQEFPVVDPKTGQVAS